MSILTSKTLGAAQPSVRKRAPSPPADFILGHMRGMRGNAAKYMMSLYREYGDVVRLRFGPLRAHVFFHPDQVQHILVRNVENFSKDVRGYHKIRALAGLGMLTGDGELWRRQRKLAQPAFMARRVLVFGDIICECAQDLATKWSTSADNGQVVDISADMMHLTLRVICRTMLGTDIENDVTEIGDAITVCLEDILFRIQYATEFTDMLPTPRVRRFQKALSVLDSKMKKIIDDRRREHAEGKREAAQQDLLDAFLLARDEQTGEGMPEKQLLDEVKTIFLAGHETTANMLSWTWYLLSKHPHVARKLHEELDTVLGDRPPTAADLPRLTYTRMVLQESMRLRPPVWATERRAINDDVIGGYPIPKGEFILVCQYVTHRHADFWENPDGFDPERFADDRQESMHKLQYFPFGVGPRICIGNHFAMLEGILILATLAQKYRLDLLPGSDIEPEPVITLRPKTPIRVTVHRRDGR
ncbi:cytochrome P450 [bacterium]|nr:cytochrome P450 [bacterium]